MGNKHYKAFISYSHKDEKFGKWLHKALEKYKIPKELRKDHPHLAKSLFPIFRDREELSTSSDLGTEILKALHHSEYLIIICSINSAKSQWVNQEIINFKAKHGEDKVYAIIIDGEPHAKDIDKFDDDLECFPEALKYKVIDGKLSDIPTEPIAGDFRKGKDGKEHGKLKLISGLLGVGFDELNRREEKRKRRNRFVLGTFIAIFISLISSFLVYISMIESSLIDVKSEIAELKLYIKSVDSQENNKTVVVLNKKLKVLLEIKREKEEILDRFGLLKETKEHNSSKVKKLSQSIEPIPIYSKDLIVNQIEKLTKENNIEIETKRKLNNKIDVKEDFSEKNSEDIIKENELTNLENTINNLNQLFPHNNCSGKINENKNIFILCQGDSKEFFENPLLKKILSINDELFNEILNNLNTINEIEERFIILEKMIFLIQNSNTILQNDKMSIREIKKILYENQNIKREERMKLERELSKIMSHLHNIKEDNSLQLYKYKPKIDTNLIKNITEIISYSLASNFSKYNECLQIDESFKKLPIPKKKESSSSEISAYKPPIIDEGSINKISKTSIRDCANNFESLNRNFRIYLLSIELIESNFSKDKVIQVFKTYGISYTHEDINSFIINLDYSINNLFDFSQSINQYMMSL